MTKEEIRTLEKIRKEMESWIEKIDAMLEGSEEDTEDIAEIKQQEKEREVAEYLMSLGMPTNVRGFKYYISAITTYMENTGDELMMTIDIYPAVAEKFNTTSSRVERAMRHAVELTWEKGNIRALKRLFGKFARNRPTNWEFISRISEDFRMMR